MKGSTFFPKFDFMNRDYDSLYNRRIKLLKWIREDTTNTRLDWLKDYYKDHIAEFISTWVNTHDSRNADLNLPSAVPFILFKKQEEWVDWLINKWNNQKPGITEKSRECGVSWLSIATTLSLCLFNKGLAIGFGSRKQDYCDKIGDMDSLLEKARYILESLPIEFNGGWNRNKDSKLMHISIPITNSYIKAESGSQIGRGGRSSMYICDESSFFEQPKLIDASLSQTTRCRIDVSTPNGMNNSFAERRHSGKIDVFTFSYLDDPRKDQDWYDKQVNELDPVTVAQEIDISYTASVEGLVIPYDWIIKAVDFHKKLPLYEFFGIKQASLDVADQGRDLNALTFRQGIVLTNAMTWSGKDSDIFKTIEKTISLMNDNNITQLVYDSDGLGAGVKGDIRVINETLHPFNRITTIEHRGSHKVPHGYLISNKSNEELFLNYKAYSWWSLRLRFQNTKRYLEGDTSINIDDCISLDSRISDLHQLMKELSSPQYVYNNAGKMLIDKSPNGSKSPNIADSIVQNFVKSSIITDNDIAITGNQVLSIKPAIHNLLSKSNSYSKYGNKQSNPNNIHKVLK